MPSESGYVSAARGVAGELHGRQEQRGHEELLRLRQQEAIVEAHEERKAEPRRDA